MPITTVTNLKAKIAAPSEVVNMNAYNITIGTAKWFFSGNVDQVSAGYTLPTTLTQVAQTQNIYSKIKLPLATGTSALVVDVHNNCGTSGSASGAVSHIMFDYLVGAGGINIATLTEQAFVVAALPRHTDGVGVYAFLIGTGTVGASATIRYLANDNVEYTSPPFVVTATGLTGANNVMPIPLANGTRGIKELRGITCAGTGTGTIAIVLAKVVATIPQVGSVYSYDDISALHMPFFKVPKDSNIINFQNGVASLNQAIQIKLASVSDT